MAISESPGIDALPNAIFVAFTGTPVASEDRDTRAVFGNYISIYDMQQSRDDGATVAIYFESRLAKPGFKVLSGVPICLPMPVEG